MNTRHGISGSTRARGFTLIEVLLALVVGVTLLAGLMGVITTTLQTRDAVHERDLRLRDARFAMERMILAVSRTTELVLPWPENAGTLQPESVRDLLAVALDPEIDRDRDGFADADNDRDGRVDEDPGNDRNDDGEAGILGLDDDNDGQVDETPQADDDEDQDTGGNADEDARNAVDDDLDGFLDEDPDRDLNGDGAPGVAGFDDDGDGTVDEGVPPDDDEDGTSDEDFVDTVAFFVNAGVLYERMPWPHAADGTQYSESALAEDVGLLRVERLPPQPGDRWLLIALRLELAVPGDTPIVLETTVRVGGDL